MGMRTRSLIVALLVAAVALVSTMTFAANMTPEASVAEQWKYALDQAKEAQKMMAMNDVKTNLQRVINCLEGPQGPNHDNAVSDKCSSMGKGMMVDAKAAGGKYVKAMPWFELATDVALIGKRATTMEKTKAAAWATQKVLEQIGGVLK
jgi:hypothetical protein